MRVDFGDAPPACPHVAHVLSHLPYPSLFALYILMAVVALVFAVWTALKYNSVRVFEDRIHTPSISNSLWIAYFGIVGLRGILNTIRFSVPRLCVGNSSADAWFLAAALTLHGLGATFLQLALNHQRRFRSDGPDVSKNTQCSETDPLMRRYQMLRRSFTAAEALFFVLLIVYIATEYLMLLHPGQHVYKWIYIGAFVAQRVPIIVLVAVVVFRNMGEALHVAMDVTPDGPFLHARVQLGIALVLCVFGDLPLRLWAEILPSNCPLWIMSGVDILLLCFIVGLGFFFGFVRAEFLRVMNAQYQATVADFQAEFDFRRF